MEKSTHDPSNCNKKDVIKPAKRKRLSNVKYIDRDPKIFQKKCEKVGCQVQVPICLIRASEKCAAFTITTSRWYHISSSEHFCNKCFEHFYRNTKSGNSIYNAWKEKWVSNTPAQQTIKTFMADQKLPYWIQCKLNNCLKWRQISSDYKVSNDFIKYYKCGSQIPAGNEEFVDHCATPEDKSVSEAIKSDWWSTLNAYPLLKACPSVPYLMPYFPGGVESSPLNKNTISNQKSEEFENFYVNKLYCNPNRALCARPNILENDEVKEFPQFAKAPGIYLAIRSLLLMLWYRKPTKMIDWQELYTHVICRGLIRVHLASVSRLILEFIARKGLINTALETPENPLLKVEWETHLETRDSIWGRMLEDPSLTKVNHSPVAEDSKLNFDLLNCSQKASKQALFTLDNSRPTGNNTGVSTVMTGLPTATDFNKLLNTVNLLSKRIDAIESHSYGRSSLSRLHAPIAFIDSSGEDECIGAPSNTLAPMPTTLMPLNVSKSSSFPPTPSEKVDKLKTMLRGIEDDLAQPHCKVSQRDRAEVKFLQKLVKRMNLGQDMVVIDIITERVRILMLAIHWNWSTIFAHDSSFTARFLGAEDIKPITEKPFRKPRRSVPSSRRDIPKKAISTRGPDTQLFLSGPPKNFFKAPNITSRQCVTDSNLYLELPSYPPSLCYIRYCCTQWNSIAQLRRTLLASITAPLCSLLQLSQNWFHNCPFTKTLPSNANPLLYSYNSTSLKPQYFKDLI
ncbi:unnamed protein product [Gordionus sp. m RMFG-2023]